MSVFVIACEMCQAHANKDLDKMEKNNTKKNIEILCKEQTNNCQVKAKENTN